MVCLKPALVFALCAVSAAANPIAALDKRQAAVDVGTANIGTVTCGDNRYSKKQIEEATAEGCRLHAANQQLGSSQYPHRFNNRENLAFASSGPYQEFPIISSGNYTGRSPGPDRIVFDPDYRSGCVYVGAMTHTGASGRNGFVSCNQTKSSSSGGGGGGSSSNGTSAASALSGPTSLGAAVSILSLLALAA
ncbi:Putative guanine-specific ribonuclease N1/T1/U2, ribonuclease/ribotoxin [Colletotrichum destructivum]|uniref:ribonuclease T1 n=1 Tax=Colletotrichum destructivum TaxID=34406 RepID=A0AAX4IWW5_9PEZI|nr:Putative guanine-specific ribonuclease N1/T1/U2, ribonuclease/ribotoxin [Colletotrichum destructivum]